MSKKFCEFPPRVTEHMMFWNLILTNRTFKFQVKLFADPFKCLTLRHVATSRLHMYLPPSDVFLKFRGHSNNMWHFFNTYISGLPMSRDCYFFIKKVNLEDFWDLILKTFYLCISVSLKHNLCFQIWIFNKRIKIKSNKISFDSSPSPQLKLIIWFNPYHSVFL